MTEYAPVPPQAPPFWVRRVLDPRCICGHPRSDHDSASCHHTHDMIEITPSWSTGARQSINRGPIGCDCRRFRADRDRYTAEQWQWMIEDGLLEAPTMEA